MFRIVRPILVTMSLVVSAGCAGGARLGVAPVARSHPSACELTAGAPLPAVHLGAVEFLTPRRGVGVSNPSPRCATQPTWMAVSTDGGAQWRAAGARVPVRSRFGDTPGVAFVSPMRSWIATGGKVFGTADGGARWSYEPLGGRVADLRVAGASVTALAVDCAGQDVVSCPVHAWSHAAEGWIDDGRLPVAAGGANPVLASDPGGRQMVAAMPTDGETRPLLLSDDRGRQWRRIADPCGRRWWFPGTVSVPSYGHLWLLCQGGGGMGSSTSALYASRDSGRHWLRVVAVANLAAIPPHGLPAGDPGELAVVGHGTRQWLLTVNGLAASTTSGRTWREIGRVRLAGAGGFATISFLNPTHGWLLAPGAGLWRTRDGRHWSRL
jgi:photosystem II stability/assembly factor-like uncharacterized protein